MPKPMSSQAICPSPSSLIRSNLCFQIILSLWSQRRQNPARKTTAVTHLAESGPTHNCWQWCNLRNAFGSFECVPSVESEPRWESLYMCVAGLLSELFEGRTLPPILDHAILVVAPSSWWHANQTVLVDRLTSSCLRQRRGLISC